MSHRRKRSDAGFDGGIDSDCRDSKNKRFDMNPSSSSSSPSLSFSSIEPFFHRSWFDRAIQALRNEDGFSLASLMKTPLAVRNLRPKAPIISQSFLSNWESEAASFEPALNEAKSHLGSMLSFHRMAVCSFLSGSMVDAYSREKESFGAFVRGFEKVTGNWLLPVLRVVCTELRRFAKRADDELAGRGGHSSVDVQKWDKMEEAARELNSCYRVMVTVRDSSAESKKVGLLCVTNAMIRVYFQINNLRLCLNSMKYVDLPQLASLKELYPMADRLTYNFYSGRLSMMDGKFHAASTSLTFAFEKCPKQHFECKRMILLYLIPVNLLIGRFPSPRLIQKYKQDRFASLASAVKRGNLVQFNESLLANQDFFIRKGIYLILEQLRMFVYRNLFRAVHRCVGDSKIPLTFLHAALKWMNVNMDFDEVECILAILIYKGFVRGYISHSPRVLVVSKQDAFPKQIPTS